MLTLFLSAVAQYFLKITEENISCIPKPTVSKYAAKHYPIVTSVDASMFFQKKNPSRL